MIFRRIFQVGFIKSVMRSPVDKDHFVLVLFKGEEVLQLFEEGGILNAVRRRKKIDRHILVVDEFLQTTAIFACNGIPYQEPTSLVKTIGELMPAVCPFNMFSVQLKHLSL